jgi:hypothetical protein
MSKSLIITDEKYGKWIADLSNRYQRSQIKAATSVNSEMLHFYWSLGRDIVEMDAENIYGAGFFNKLSTDLKSAIPTAKGFSPTNLRYIKNYYLMERFLSEISPQVEEYCKVLAQTRNPPKLGEN